ncbi:Alkaline phosphatase synthesis sensor protein PhoR [compost metagenome]
MNRMQRKMKRKKEQLAQEREEAQAFMSSVQEGLISITPEQKILYFNSQFAAQFLDPAQMNIAGLSLKDIFRIPEILEGFEKVYLEGKVHRFTIKLNTRIENQARFFAVSVNPLRKSQSREVYGIIGIFHDITDLKKAEQVRIDFVGNASHELRTPLTAVKGYVETLREDVKTGHFDQTEKFVNIISRNVDRLIDLVNDLLSLSTLESGSELKLEMVAPLQISEHVVSELLGLASEKNQSIRVIGEVPPFMADARKVEQVLRNLVSNSVKYIPSGGTVQIRWEKDANNNVVLRVIDDGPGIPEEHHDRLFERFYRIDKGRTRDAGGTGLGLAIVKHIMQSHGGTVTVKNGERGAEFVCTFPQVG